MSAQALSELVTLILGIVLGAGGALALHACGSDDENDCDPPSLTRDGAVLDMCVLADDGGSCCDYHGGAHVCCVEGDWKERP